MTFQDMFHYSSLDNYSSNCPVRSMKKTMKSKDSNKQSIVCCCLWQVVKYMYVYKRMFLRTILQTVFAFGYLTLVRIRNLHESDSFIVTASISFTLFVDFLPSIHSYSVYQIILSSLGCYESLNSYKLVLTLFSSLGFPSRYWHRRW